MHPRLLLLPLVGLLLLAACVADGPPPRPQPREVPAQPGGLRVDRVVPALDKLADDSDRNGYYDTIRVAVFLFSNSYTQSIEAEGTLTFRLTNPVDDSELARWVYTPEQVRQAWGRSGIMPGYNFLLNLNDVGSDHLTVDEALFSCTFKPVNGPPVETMSRLVVLVGALR